MSSNLLSKAFSRTARRIWMHWEAGGFNAIKSLDLARSQSTAASAQGIWGSDSNYYLDFEYDDPPVPPKPARTKRGRKKKKEENGSSKKTKKKKAESSKKSKSENGAESQPKAKSKKKTGTHISADTVEKFLQENLLSKKDKFEIVLEDDMSRATPQAIEKATKSLDLYWHAYGHKKDIVRVISKFPLPRYRPEFDPRMRQRHRVGLSLGTQRVVEITLNTLKQQTGEEDWVHPPDKDFISNQPGPPTPPTHPSLINGSREDSPAMPSYLAPDAFRANDTDLQSETGNRFVCGVLEPSSIPDKITEESARMKAQQEAFLKSAKGIEMMNVRRNLPAWNMKEELLDTIARKQVVVVSGETGCGKTTQLPQFILENETEAGRGAGCSIICTQPRRISAMSVAQRVADERGECAGQSVGYQIRLESERSRSTRLLFCTSGVLLRRLITDPSLEGVSHIVVDEIHERGMNEDFLLIVLRKLLQRRKDLRLILMSATLNAEMFSSYFGGAPAMHIPGFTYPVQDFYLEDVLEKTGFHIAAGDVYSQDKRAQWYIKAKKIEDNPAVLRYCPSSEEYRNYSLRTFDSIKNWASCGNDRLNYGVIEAIIQEICMREPLGGVLVFMTGWDDIAAMTDILGQNPIVGDPSSVKILPLHSNLASVNQQEIFQSPPTGVRKVVLATNIAETSITINDIVYVIDGGKAKEKTYDALNKIACLFPTWISKASTKQRRGRAGRVRPGVCYHLFPKPMFENHFVDHQLPEIMRMPLEQLCLTIKSLGLGDINQFLAEAINPPSPQTVHNAITHLRAIGAMDSNEDLTALGRHLVTLPVEPGIGKMILMSAMFSCLDPILTIAAATTVKDPFLRPPPVRKEADTIRRLLAAGTRSDQIALIRAFDGFQEAKMHGTGRKWDYCRSNFLSHSSFEQMEQMRYHFAELLANIGFIRMEKRPASLMSRRRSPSGRYYLEAVDKAISDHSKNAANLDILRAVLCAGLFPSVAAVWNGRSSSKKPSFMTIEDGSCRPHPSSVNGFERFFPHRWLAYGDKVQTGGIFFRTSTMVTDLSLLLFGADLEIQGTKGNFSILNGRYLFTAKPEVTKIIAGLRQELQALLEKKIKQPSLDLDMAGGSVVAAVMTLLTNESESIQIAEEDSGVENMEDDVQGLDL